MSRAAARVLLLVPVLCLLITPHAVADGPVFDVKAYKVGVAATEEECAPDDNDGRYDSFAIRCIRERRRFPSKPLEFAFRCTRRVLGPFITVRTPGRVRYRGRLRKVVLGTGEVAEAVPGSPGIGCFGPGEPPNFSEEDEPDIEGAVEPLIGYVGMEEATVAWYDLQCRVRRVEVTFTTIDAEDGRKRRTVRVVPIRDRWAVQCFYDEENEFPEGRPRVVANPDARNRPPALAATWDAAVTFSQGQTRPLPRVRFYAGGYGLNAEPVDDPADPLSFRWTLDGNVVFETPPRALSPGVQQQLARGRGVFKESLYPAAVFSVPMGGVHIVKVTATDSRGAVAEQSFRVRCESSRTRGWPFPFRPGL